MTLSLIIVQAVERIYRRYPDFVGAVIALNMQGQFGAACHGIGQRHIVLDTTWVSWSRYSWLEVDLSPPEADSSPSLVGYTD